jgi:crossover junction endodeoxyribonuclease RuvC
MTLKIVGIDPGLSATGIGVVKGLKQTVYDYAFGTLRTYQKDSLPQRLESIYSRLCKILQEESPDLLIIEDIYSLDQYPKSGINLGKVCGVILLAGQQARIPMCEIPVREAKQVLTGNGGASKVQLEKAVRSAIGLEDRIRPYHASDALGLALIGLFRYGAYRQLGNGRR